MYDLVHNIVMTIVVCDMQFENLDTQCTLCGENQTTLWWKMVFAIHISRVSWLIAPKPIEMQCELWMVVGMQTNQWLIGNKIIIFIIINWCTHTQNNKSR